MHLADPILTALGVKSITATKEAWVSITLAVAATQLFVAALFSRDHVKWCMAVYLPVATLRELGHFWSWWDWTLEIVVAVFALLATITSMMTATFSVKEHQRRYARQGILIFAGVGVAWAAYQIPIFYPDYSRPVQMIRTYTEVFCVGTLALSLVYICGNWNFNILRDPRSINAIVLLAWFVNFIWADRNMGVLDAWFPPALWKLAIQASALVAWIILEAVSVSRESCRAQAYRV